VIEAKSSEQLFGAADSDEDDDLAKEAEAVKEDCNWKTSEQRMMCSVACANSCPDPQQFDEESERERERRIEMRRLKSESNRTREEWDAIKKRDASERRTVEVEFVGKKYKEDKSEGQSEGQTRAVGCSDSIHSRLPDEEQVNKLCRRVLCVARTTSEGGSARSR
jgi:hypothetical protein